MCVCVCVCVCVCTHIRSYTDVRGDIRSRQILSLYRSHRLCSLESHCIYLDNSCYISLSMESHEVERQLVKLVCPVVILGQVVLQVETDNIKQFTNINN